MRLLRDAYNWLETRAVDRDPVYRYAVPLCVVLAFLGTVFGLSAIAALNSPESLP